MRNSYASLSLRLSFLIFPDVLFRLTKYGASVQTRFTLVSSSKALNVSGKVESPQITVCFPRCQMSPVLDLQGFSSSASTSKSSCFASSLSIANKSAISFSSKPVSPRSNPRFCNSSISTARSSSSQPASNAIRLSLSM